VRLVDEMRAERARQIEKWGRQKLSLRVWAWVWLEEVGEYCEARLELRAAEKELKAQHERLSQYEIRVLFGPSVDQWRARAREELVQVLTVVWAFVADYRPWHGLWRV